MDSFGFKLAQVQQLEVYLLNLLEHLCSERERIHGH